MEATIESDDSGPVPDRPSPATLSSLKSAVWKRSPILADIIQRRGAKNLLEFTRDFFSFPSLPITEARRHELISVARELTADRLGATVADGVVRQLEKFPLVSTADHHGPIDHPFFVNSNIIDSLPFHQRQDPDLRYLVVFSFATVSINNASAYPRGILFHGGINGSSNLIRIPILPDREKMGVAYTMRPFTPDDIARAHRAVDSKGATGTITRERCVAVHQCLDTYFSDPSVLDTASLAEQITKINFNLWPDLFHTAETSSNSDVQIPDLVYLDIESLTRELLIRFHLPNTASSLHQLLTNPGYHQAMKIHFDNIPGAFSEEKQWGTHLFWALNDRQHRKRMTLQQGRLVAEGMDYSVATTVPALTQALREKKIMPSMMLCYLMVALYYGMKCLGGFSQVNDLTATKRAWQQLLRQMGDAIEADAIEPTDTTAYGGDGLVLSYLPTITGSLVPATGIDMLFHDVESHYEHFLQLAQSVTLEEISSPMLPEIYSVYYPATDRTPELQSLTPEHILKLTQMDKKLVRASTPRPMPIASSNSPRDKQPLARPVTAG
ncbi:MAG: hypothetical protein ACOYUK_00485 [Patescibacteria group bacterium]